MPQKKLEQYQWFPIIAWTTCICFAVYVAILAINLNQTAEELKQSSMNLNQKFEEVEMMFNESRAPANTDTN